MNIFYKKSWLFICTVIIGSAAFAQQGWPKSITGSNGDLIKIYQPQVESYSGNTLKSRSAVSVIQDGKTDPIFGAFWWQANVADNGSNVTIQSINITNIKFPDGIDDAAAADIKNKLESEIPEMRISISKDELENSVNNTQQQAKQSSSFNNTPPKVIYTTKPSMLVLIDGQPKLQRNSSYGVDAVVNSPFTIVKNSDGRFYLYGGKNWYSASSATGPFTYTDNVPGNLEQIETAVKNNQKNNDNNNGSNNDDAASNNSNAIPEIIVSTEPAELIQSDGEANFTPVESTGLLYVKNSANDIFMDVNSQQYYVLLSGRWYRSSSLRSQWQYIPSDKLPADFAKIPAGSPKDNVLASVAGTDEAQEAIMDAAIPQTAKVDRRTATASITYDGDPQFDNITGTRLQYAINASATVLKIDGMYYAIDNGVWFQSNRPSGPWEVSTTRPAEVDNIPPSYPVYNSKYVYVYDATPDYVYTGYTPGYLNAYVYGPTIVYGTGYYYRPWFRNHYYARPYTWGFSMNYTPWYGWGFGYGFGYNWFDIGFGFSSWWGGGYSYGGWWGPSIYRPCYSFGGGYNRNYGYYGYNRGYAYRNSVRVNYNYNNNIYNNNRRYVTSYNNRSFVNNNRYNNNFNRGGAFNNRGRDGNRFNNNNGGNRMGNNDGVNNNRYNNNNDRGGSFNNRGRDGNRFNNGNGANGTPGRTYSPQGQQNNPRNFDNNRTTPGNSDNNGFGGRRRDFQNQNTPGDNGNRNSNQPPTRQREYNPQRSTDNSNRNFSRPQPQQQQQQAAPQRSAPSFDRGGGGGSRPSFGGGNGGGGGSRPSFGGGNGGGGRSGGGGGEHGGGGGGRGGGRRG